MMYCFHTGKKIWSFWRKLFVAALSFASGKPSVAWNGVKISIAHCTDFKYSKFPLK